MEKEVLVSLRPTTEQSAGEEIASYLGDLVGQRQYLDRKGCFTGEQATPMRKKTTRVCSSNSVLHTLSSTMIPRDTSASFMVWAMRARRVLV